MALGDLSDEEWRVVEPLLPTERGRKSRPSHENCRFFNGMLHVLRVGSPWRDMHERYGSGIRPMFGSVAGPNMAYGTHFWKHLSNLG
ncbi:MULTISPECIES: transposase [unclassified Ensifer]|uniref:transposase n=1 Tax=unclassified Ensifer TaxID=2633371 RepID=UPI001FCCC41D|nr:MULTISPECIES: transposase [unclassified Ensifer]